MMTTVNASIDWPRAAATFEMYRQNELFVYSLTPIEHTHVMIQSRERRPAAAI